MENSNTISTQTEQSIAEFIRSTLVTLSLAKERLSSIGKESIPYSVFSESGQHYIDALQKLSETIHYVTVLQIIFMRHKDSTVGLVTQNSSDI
jgi:hypothetical protein